MIPDISTYNISVIQEKYRNNGFEFLGRGANRIVFTHPDTEYVYKVPISPTGERQNKNAYEISQDLSNNVIAPIKELTENMVLIQKYVEPVDETYNVSDLKERISQTNYTYIDWKEENIGKYHGKIVIIDIGGFT